MDARVSGTEVSSTRAAQENGDGWWTPWWTASEEASAAWLTGGPLRPWARFSSEYLVDAWQRSVLFLDVLRRRGNNHLDRIAQQAPNVLSFAYELVVDGRTLERPVNYCLVRIVPPAGTLISDTMRPFIVFDPRAGHGPGIGGMKHDSEIGVALQAGHPCYFVGFLPHPVPGQTIEDVCRAEALFVERVIELHPEAHDKPCLIGNCQAGWQIMMMSATRPDLAGPIVLAGAPLSYWAGVHGRHPLRYLGGLLGGTWLTSLAGDLGNGIFDGAMLVANFENMNPSNTLWKKNYNVYANVDTEAERFLEFENWWGSPVLLNAGEMQFIADELFIGNKLTSGEIFLSDDTRVDLRNIASPIIVFCSWGDDITPPQQALGWILDVYDDDDALIAGGQTIVYALHQSIGHLGIFVSAKVATKEHDEFTRAMDLIDTLPPGLYEAVFAEKAEATVNAELVSGNYVVRFEPRKLADIRALGGNDPADDARFAAVARLSEVNQGSYRTYLSPAVRTLWPEQAGEWLRDLHPHRMRFELFSDKNPFMQPVAAAAESIRASRKPASPGNPFVTLQEAMSNWIVNGLDGYRELRDRSSEAFFLNFYGSPALHAALGLRSDAAIARPRIGRDVAREAAEANALFELEAKISQGGLVEAGVRALLYVAGGASLSGIDERAFAALRQLRRDQAPSEQLNLARFKEIVREQFLLLYRDEERAMAVIPLMLPENAAAREAAFEAIRRVCQSAGGLPEPLQQRLSRVEALYKAGPALPNPSPVSVDGARISPQISQSNDAHSRADTRRTAAGRAERNVPPETTH